ncbi:hypothetical protein FPOA_06467 [Fusarium poae]|uniref:Uncharacterized protein n=1 Tax=Fusarium poae TaxID=36050 RepID=A0A1B8AZM4_FUSPO|nr:hypothetical protein FPOA_06467 [Fusarium poae]
MTGSISHFATWLIISTLVVGSRASDDGDDFSNNLFSDLAPLLALFGERVTMQFMSQSTGWADNIILAMAPIGIITAIVASIRVGGPPWLKAVIGRARENLAVSEVELMSSTSKEVCEVWNGQEVVRCMGLAPVVEFICLLHYTNTGPSESKSAPEIEVLKLEEAIAKGYVKDLDGDEKPQTASTCEGDEEQANPTPNACPTAGSESASTSIKSLRKICIIRDTSGDSPNIILNCHPSANSGELWLFAVFGTCLQLGVLAYSGFATYHPVLKFQKDDKPIESYAYPCTAIGTLVLVLGMLLCGHVVESSTDEKRYEAVAGWRARMVWLQQTKTVSDQVFNSYMVYPKDDRQTITTSRRSNKHGKDRSTTHTGSNSAGDDDPSTFLNVITVTGTAITLCGFVLQFVGLRGMHWSASIAQLGAVLVMVGVKAWVRRGLATSPACEPLPSGFELDWFTRTLGGIETEAWSGKKDGSGFVDAKIARHPGTIDFKWNIVTGGRSSLEGFEQSKGGSSESCGGSVSEKSQLSAPHRNQECGIDAQALLEARKRLAYLAGWKGPTSTEAVSLARAMECTMDALETCLPGTPQSLTWVLEARYLGLSGQEIRITLFKEIGGWKVNAAQIESILSLWLSSVDEEESLLNEDMVSDQNKGSQFQEPKIQDEWLRSKDTIARRSLRILGRRTPSLVRDLLWWVPKDILSVFQIQEDQVGSLRAALQIGKHRVVGYDQQDEGSEQHPSQLQYLEPEGNDSGNRGGTFSDYYHFEFDRPDGPTFFTGGYDDDDDNIYSPGGLGPESDEDCSRIEGEIGDLSKDYTETSIGTVSLLGNESDQSLRTLFAMDLFSSFTRAFAKVMTASIPGGTEDIQPDSETDDTRWNIFALRNNQLSKLIQNIHNTGLGKLGQIYLSVITPLSREKRLPNIDAVIDLALQHSRRNERSRKWEAAGDDLIWLFRLANGTFSRCDNILAKATANLMEYHRMTRLVLRIRVERNLGSVHSDNPEIWRLRVLLDRIRRELEVADLSLRQLIGKTYRCLSLPKRQDYSDYATKALDSFEQKSENVLAYRRDILERTKTHYVAFSLTPFFYSHCYMGYDYEVNSQDLLGRTALHYICFNDGVSLEKAEWMINHGAELDIAARDGATPLHYAAMRGNRDKVKLLIEAGATVDVLDLAGRSPLHTAAVHGHVTVIDYLWDKARPELRDRWGWTVLHLAAMFGSVTVVEYLVRLNIDKDAKDRLGRTALCLAVIAGSESVTTLLIDQGADTKTTGKNDIDIFCLAARAGNVKIIKFLIDRGLDGQWRDRIENGPLKEALRYGSTAVARLLMKEPVRYDWKDTTKQSLLHFAAQCPNNTALIQDLIDAGCDVNSKDHCYDSPLHYAIKYGRTSNVKCLIEKGADIEQTGESGRTALWIAVHYRRSHIVQLLLNNGASTNITPDILGSRTLSSWAEGDKKIIDMIQRHQLNPKDTSHAHTSQFSKTSQDLRLHERSNFGEPGSLS